MFENIILLLITYMVAAVTTAFFIKLSNKIDKLKEAHRDNKLLKMRIKQIKNRNKDTTLFAIKIAVAEVYRHYNDNSINYKLLERLANAQFSLYKEIGAINEWNKLVTEESVCR